MSSARSKIQERPGSSWEAHRSCTAVQTVHCTSLGGLVHNDHHVRAPLKLCGELAAGSFQLTSLLVA